MKLIGSMIVRNELHRYLRWSLPALLDFCDEVRILDDASDDGWADVLGQELPGYANDRVHVLRTEEPKFFEHEGRARNVLLNWTFKGEPTHVLAIDADEFVSDGQALRAACENARSVALTLTMEEIWRAEEECLCVRTDGGWRPHEVPILYSTPNRRDHNWRIADLQLACGREPLAVRRQRKTATGVEILHFGWANVAERAARYQRYVEADGGRFHQSSHLLSIMWPDESVGLEGRAWPEGLDRPALLARASSTLPA